MDAHTQKQLIDALQGIAGGGKEPGGIESIADKLENIHEALTDVPSFNRFHIELELAGKIYLQSIAIKDDRPLDTIADEAVTAAEILMSTWIARKEADHEEEV